MAHKKGAASNKNGRDSNAQRLGVKRFGGQVVGAGGSIILQVDTSVTTLVDYHHSPKRRAENGGQGAGDHKNGGNGKDLFLTVPDGTTVKDVDGSVLADLVGHGTTLVIAAGGRGGLGNAALASSKRKAPGFALLGEPGDELVVRLELKVVA